MCHLDSRKKKVMRDARNIDLGDGKPSITLGEETRVFRHWADPAPGCISGVTVAIYANEHGAVLMVGMCLARYTDPAKLRELATGLVRTAEILEAGE
jgi:hypothetical protein